MPSATNNGVTLEAHVLDGGTNVGVEGTVSGSPSLGTDIGSWNDKLKIEWNPNPGNVGDQIQNQVQSVRSSLQPDGIRGRIASEVVSKHIPNPTVIATVTAEQLQAPESFRWEANDPPKTRIVVPEKGAIHDNVSGVPVTLNSWFEGLFGGSAGAGPSVDLTVPTEAFIEEVPLDTLTNDLNIRDPSFPETIDPTSPPTSITVPVANGGSMDLPVVVEAFGQQTEITVPAGTTRSASLTGLNLSRPSDGSLEETVSVYVPGDDTPITRTITAEWPAPTADLIVEKPEIQGSVPTPGNALSALVRVRNAGNVPAEATVELFGESKTKTVSPGETVPYEFGTTVDDSGDFTIQPVVTSPSLDSAISSRRTVTIPGGGQEAVPEFSIGRPQAPSSIPTPGNSFDVSVPVENIGNAKGTAEVAMLGNTKTTTLAPGASESLTFSVTPDSAGDLTLTPQLTNQATGATKSASRTITVPQSEPEKPEEPTTPPSNGQQSGAQFSFVAVNAPSQAYTNERYEVSATVKNTGSQKGSVVVTADGYDKERSYTLSPGGTATFTLEQRREEARTYTYTFQGDVGESVTFYNADISRTVVVPVITRPRQPPQEGVLATRSFVLGNTLFTSRFILKVFSAEIEGDQTVVEVGVENQPLGEGFYSDIDVVARGGGGSDSVTVNPGWNETVRRTLTIPRTGNVEVVMKQTFPSGWESKQAYFGDDGQPKVTAYVPAAPPEPPAFEILGLKFPDVVDIAEQYVGEIRLKNVGEQSGEVAVSGPGIDAQRSVPAGEEATFEAKLKNTSPRPRFLSYTIRNVSEGTTKQIRRTVGTEVAQLVIQNVSVPDTVDPGSTFDVQAIIANNGGADAEYVASIGGEKRQGSLSAGASKTLTFQQTLSGYQPANLNLQVTNARTGQVAASRTLTVEPNVPSFALQNVSVPESVPFGEQATVTATVENVGGAAGEYAVSMGDTTRSGQLGPGTTATVEFPVTADTISAQSYSLVLRNATLDRRVTAQTVEVASATPSFTIESVDAPQSLPPGERATIGVTVANTGNSAGEAVVSVAGQTATRTIQPGSSATVNVQYQKGDSPVDVLNPTVSWEPAGRMDSARVRIESVTPDITLQSIDAPEEVPRGQQFTVTGVIANDGGAAAPLVVNIGGTTRTGTIQPNSTRTFRVQLVKGPQATQRIPVSVMVEGMPERSTSRTLTVSAAQERQAPSPPSQPPAAPSPPSRPAPGGGQEGDDVPAFVAEFLDFVDALNPFDGQQ